MPAAQLQVWQGCSFISMSAVFVLLLSLPVEGDGGVLTCGKGVNTDMFLKNNSSLKSWFS